MTFMNLVCLKAELLHFDIEAVFVRYAFNYSDYRKISLEYTTDDGENGVSILDLQRYNDELHVQSYHLHSKNGVVLRTQSIFEIKPAEVAD